MRRLPISISDLAFCGGVVFLALGLGLIFLPLALIALGCGCLAIAWVQR